ncbi:MAG TPA: SDR family NAD(P)-dependent oxidoreductase, partial [Ktedonobacteraceae bacterium]|nr:SDR family NAD(P)-dependent oxidoreductase [Ktedonobacteraceae bacterium]
AGVTGLIKTTLALHHRLLPPSLHFTQPNPGLEISESPFYVNSKLATWETQGMPRRAGVSSFGIGGTNAHVILEEAPMVPDAVPERAKPYHLLILSAKTGTALQAATTNLAAHLKEHPELALANVAYTLQIGRQPFHHRRAIVCRDLPDAIETLETQDPARVLTKVQEEGSRQIVFLFPGQGSQYSNMALELYQHEAVFRKQVDICAELLKPHLSLDIRTILYPASTQEEEARQQLTQTWLSQPALFVVEYSLAVLWMERKIRPVAMVGHSIGEYVAACLAGVFSLEEALALVAARGRLMQRMAGGSMLAVHLNEQELVPLLGEQLSLAAINTDTQCVASGPMDAIEILAHQLQQRGVEFHYLHTSHAFHSKMMDPVLAVFAAEITRVKLHTPKIRYISNVTGTWITDAQATDPQYWVQHLRQTVRFADGMQEILQTPGVLFLEIGPGQTLGRLTRQLSSYSPEIPVFSTLRTVHEQQGDLAFLLQTCGRLWLAGVDIDWGQLHDGEARFRVPLPTYPFERQRYWLEAGPREQESALPRRQRTTGQRLSVPEWFSAPNWQQTATPDAALPASLLTTPRCWLVFRDNCGLGAYLSEQLIRAGQSVITVVDADSFACIDAQTYALNPRKREDYESLFKTLRARDTRPQCIVHAWLVTPQEPTELGGDRLEQMQDRGFFSLLFLSQALDQQGWTDALQLTVLTNHVYNVTGAELLSPEKVTVLGPCKVLPQEYPHISCQHIDVQLPETATRQKKRLFDLLLKEILTAPQIGATSIAYRGDRRWTQTFESIVPKWSNTPSDVPLREEGVYLITGGLGDLALVIAEYLARQVRARLVLVGRSAFPAKETWVSRLKTLDVLDPLSRKIQQLQELETLGADVLVCQADVTDLRAMQQVLQRARSQFGTIHGVIHTAGVPGGGLMQLKTRESAEHIMAPKVKGALVLHEILQDQTLDFFVLFSSLSAILGGFGQVDYCAANLFLDAFANWRSANTENFTLSLNWDVWQEVGMALRTANPLEQPAQRQEKLEQGILPEKGCEAFRLALATGLEQIVISTRDLHSQFERVSRFTVDSLLAQEGQTDALPTHPRANLTTSYVAARNEIEHQVASIWQTMLGIEPVGVYDNFFDLGGHSLLASRIMSKVREVFQVELSARHLFETSTVAGLALAIARSQQEHIDGPIRIERIDRGDEEQLLEHFQQLSDQEVDELLKALTVEEKE